MAFFRNFLEFRNEVLVIFIALAAFAFFVLIAMPTLWQKIWKNVFLALEIVGLLLFASLLPAILKKPGLYVLDFKAGLAIVSKTAFQILLAFLLLLLLAVEFFPAFKQLDTAIILFFVIAFGAASLFFGHAEKEPEQKPASIFDFFLIACFAIIAAFLVFAKTSEAGNISIILSFSAGLLVFACCWLLMLGEAEATPANELPKTGQARRRFFKKHDKLL